MDLMEKTERRGKYTVLRGLVTTARLVQLFGKSELTVREWMFNHGLPYVVVPGDERDSIRFRLAEVRKWARDNGKEIVG